MSHDTQVKQEDSKAIHDLFYEYHYADDLGVIKSKLAEYVATARREERLAAYSAVANNIAAVLDADDVEAFTALIIMKATRSPDLNSETRSALKSEAEIRREEREAAGQIAFTEAIRQGISAERAIAIKSKIEALCY